MHSINRIVTEKENLENLIEAELPQLETQLILNLFRNRVIPEELERIMPRFGARKNRKAALCHDADPNGQLRRTRGGG
ncbi:hypothetical protein VQ056_03405 [Paenibacillus sp. JTLBN-2024]